MELLTKFVGFFLLLFFFEYITSDPLIAVTLQKCYGACNKNYCNVTIRCRPLNRTSKWKSIDVYFRPGLKFEAPINIETIGYKKYGTVYRQNMVKLKTELCTILDNTNHPFFSRFWVENITGNLRDPCPLTRHRYMKPFVAAYDHFPLFPVGEYKLEYVISKGINNLNEFIVSWTEFYEIKPTSAIEF